MFCHNAYPDIPAGHDQLRAEPVFSGALPEGIDCQRCHGPGARHVEIARRTACVGGSHSRMRSSIRRALNADRQMEVCMQCHLETDQLSVSAFDSQVRSRAIFVSAGRAARGFHAVLRPRAGRTLRTTVFRLLTRFIACECRMLLEKRRQVDVHHVPRSARSAADIGAGYNAVCRQCHSAACRPR